MSEAAALSPWLPATSRFRRATAIGLGVALLPLVGLLAVPVDSIASDTLAGLAWLIMGVVMLAANLERQRRAMPTRLPGHRWLGAGIGILYASLGLGHIFLAVTGDTPEPWVHELPLLLSIVPLCVGLVLLCWPPGTTRRDVWMILGDAFLTGFALLAIWVLIVVPAHPVSDVSGLGRQISMVTPWMQYMGVLAMVVVAAASRRPGALPVQQLILLQACVLTFINADILYDLLGVSDPLAGHLMLLAGGWIAAVLYRFFTQRPALEDETSRQFLLRSLWSVTLPTLVLISMGLTVIGYRMRVGPLTSEAVTVTVLALLTASVVIAIQRVLVAFDVESMRMARVRTSLAESAKAQWFSALLGQAQDLVTVVERSGHIVFQTPSISHLFGYDTESLRGRHVSSLFDEVSEEQMNRWLLESVHVGVRPPLDLALRDAGGRLHETETVIRPLRADGSDGYVVTTRDVSDKLRLTAALAESGHRDPLTGLNNREGFLAALHRVTATSGSEVAVVLMDIVNFRDINDSRGHTVGDTLLRATASALDRLPSTVTVAARIGADEFALVVVDDNVDRAVGQIDRVLREAMHRVVVDDGAALEVSFSLGYVTRLPVNDTASALLERADLALAAARTTGSRTPVKYETEMRSALVTRLREEADLRQALDGNRLVVHYQPIIELASGRLASVEALVRMRDPKGGLIPPDQFIPQAEELGLIGRLGQAVLDTAVSDILVINAALGREVSVAVNVSAQQIDPELPQMVSDVLRRHGVKARSLIIEVTESSLVRHATSAVILGELRAMGCSIAVDDFGTGYSSLSYLVGLPVDELKIDRSFIGQLADSHRSLSLVRVLLQMAGTLALGVVAEGVETVEQADLLRGMGCTWAQGYLYAAPMPLDDLVDAVAGPEAVFSFTR